MVRIVYTNLRQEILGQESEPVPSPTLHDHKAASYPELTALGLLY
ncbi:hypothetical protein T11_1959 [Trichinella zimbabwensis]|uniref:Uncharacterized protein n=1 Tax=Trichinella zimbabwensis TaxID=268475 RepID=A0A0V1GA73_9BILA|nr:hypothetical protein T11_1959 [Trichinella zimbabwensis]